MGKIGKCSIEFDNKPLISASASVVGQKEGEGPLGEYFDRVIDDPMAGQNTWEEAESEMQRQLVDELLIKSGLQAKEIRYFFAGDLLGQLIATSFGISGFEVPVFGLYGACSTMGEALSLAAMTVSAGYADNVIAMTSSHFGSAEKQFRFPLDYGNQRPLCATWTVTGAGGVILSASGESDICVSGITTGRIVDYGIQDSFNMGAAMAPAACDVIYNHLMDFERRPEDYDAIYTGDLGSVGQTILIDLMDKRGFDISKVHHDCGVEIYDAGTQDTHAGGSGCGCSAATLSAQILRRIREGEYSRVLFVPTGALLSAISFNEGKTVPGIAHAVVIEKIDRGGEK
ncbi:stage V sporulation protein AD [Butyrivibrio sp. CAG:318]|jgi:stage V sporulation protein AD|nr:stage V sporulation protein AD [Butyrivibrio sp. CAG:318]